jgi:hypothetical protein
MMLLGKPDLVLWKKVGSAWVFHDGLRRVAKLNGGLWQPQIRDSVDSEDWRPLQTWKSGGAMNYTTLTIAQEQFQKVADANLQKMAFGAEYR